jgi:hypothetical protein
MIQSLLGVAVVIGLAFAIGFRSAASPLAWLAAIGLLALTALALTWLTVAMGLAAKSVETVSQVSAIAWGAGVALGAYLWARHVYNTRPLPVR